MFYLIVSILSSTAIVLIFRLFGKYDVQGFPAICINYLVCSLCAWLSLGRFPLSPSIFGAEWWPWAMGLGVIFITGFNFVALTVRHFNVTVGAVMQKMSLLLTVLFALLYYRESFNTWKGFGFAAALAAIMMINWPNGKERGVDPLEKWMYIFPVLALLVSAAIEIGLLYVDRTYGKGADLPFVGLLFTTAALLGNATLLTGWSFGRLRVGRKELLGGIALGIPNFFSIFFLLRAVGSGWEGSVVFPINNVGIIGLSAILAVVLLRERLSVVNIAGVICAVVAILLLTAGS